MKMNNVIVILLLILEISKPVRTDNSTIFDRLDIEKYIPSTIESRCHLVIVSKENFDFEPTSRPVLLLDQVEIYLPFRHSCGIVFIPDLDDVIEQFRDKNLNRDLETTVSTFMILTDLSDIRILKKIRNVFNIVDLVLIDRVTGLKREIIRKKCGHNLRCALNGQSLRVGFTSREPHLKFWDWAKYDELNETIPAFRIGQTNPAENYFTGLEANILSVMIEMYGISFDMIAAQGSRIQNYSEDSEKKGKFGLLERGDVDMVIGHVMANYERSQLGEYSTPILMEKYTLCSKKPDPLPEWDSALRPFPLIGWTLLMASIIAVGPAAWWFERLHQKWAGIKGKDQSLLQISAQATATLLTEPWRNPPSGPSALVVGTWLMGCLILQCIYSSNFMAHLSIPSTESPIDTLEDLYKSGRPILNRGTPDTFIRTSTNPMIQKLAERSVRRETDVSQFDKLNQGYVSIHDAVTFSHMIRKFKKKRRDYHISPKPFLTLPCGWLFAEDDGLVALAINTAILRLSENGLVEKWIEDMMEEINSRRERHYQTQTQRKLDTTLQQKELPLSISHLKGVFVLWGFGMLAASLVFIFEKSITIWRLMMMARRKAKPKKPKISIFPYLE